MYSKTGKKKKKILLYVSHPHLPNPFSLFLQLAMPSSQGGTSTLSSPRPQPSPLHLSYADKHSFFGCL